MNSFVLPVLMLIFLSTLRTGLTCRIGSEALKNHVRQRIESLLDSNHLEKVYWPEEPIDSDLIGKSTGLNITSAKTQFKLKTENNTEDNSSFIDDILITCSTNRDKSYTLAINAEIENPFKIIDLSYEIPLQAFQNENNIPGSQMRSLEPATTERYHQGHFRIQLLDSTFLLQLNQVISYDGCIVVSYVQLAPNVNYDIECVGCSQAEQKYLDRIFGKRMNQIDRQIDSLLSEKMMIGLKVLFDQQRLDLDLYLV